MGRFVVGRVQKGAALWILRLVLLWRAHCTCAQVVAIVFAVIGRSIENTVDIQTLTAVGKFFVARPLNSRDAGKLFITHAAVVAGTAARTFLPGFEGSFRVRPLDKWLAIFIGEFHSPGIVKKNIEIRFSFAGRLDRLMGNVYGAIGVGKATSFLAPQRCWKND